MCVLNWQSVERVKHRFKCCRWGTREALHRGRRCYLDGHARLLLQGFAHSAKALPDDFGSLGQKQCHIARDGEVFTGKAWAGRAIMSATVPYCGSEVVVRRYPIIMLPSNVDCSSCNLVSAILIKTKESIFLEKLRLVFNPSDVVTGCFS